MNSLPSDSGAENSAPVAETQEKQPGAERLYPAEEEEELEEESYLYAPGTQRVRVISSFLISAGGQLAPIHAKHFINQNFNGFEAVGIVATIHGKEGLFSQCAWFGTHSVDWFWARLPDIRKVEVREDVRFRGGERCIWLTTPHAEYAMVLPHKTYADLWEQSLSEMGPFWLASTTGTWPTTGSCPWWWDVRWSDSWPFRGQPSLKRRMVDDADHLEDPEIGGDNSVGLVNEAKLTRRKWIRLGHKGDRSRPGEPLSHLHHLSHWDLERDSGMFPSVEAQDSPDSLAGTP